MYLPLYMFLLCRTTGLAYSLCFLTIQRGIQAFSRNQGVEMLSQCWIAGSLLFAMEHLLKNSQEDFWVFQDQQKKPTLVRMFYIWGTSVPTNAFSFNHVAIKMTKKCGSQYKLPPQYNKKQGLKRKSLAHEKLQTKKS